MNDAPFSHPQSYCWPVNQQGFGHYSGYSIDWRHWEFTKHLKSTGVFDGFCHVHPHLAMAPRSFRSRCMVLKWCHCWSKDGDISRWPAHISWASWGKKVRQLASYLMLPGMTQKWSCQSSHFVIYIRIYICVYIFARSLEEANIGICSRWLPWDGNIGIGQWVNIYTCYMGGPAWGDEHVIPRCSEGACGGGFDPHVEHGTGDAMLRSAELYR